MRALRPKMRHTGKLAVAVLAAALPAAASASAGGTMTVSATVLPRCMVEAGEMTFGTLAGDGPQASAQSQLTLECTPGTAYAVTLDEGLRGDRRMVEERGIGFLDYEIFQDAAGTRRWDASAAGSVAGVAPSDGRISLNAYGRIAGQATTAGRYGDVVTVTVQF